MGLSLETSLLLAIGAMQTISTAAFMIGTWKRGREAADDTLAERVANLRDQVDRAGQKMSDLSDKVQSLEIRLRKEFVLDEWCKERMRIAGESHTPHPPQAS